MLDKDFNAITFVDIRELKELQVREGINIDYKESLNLKGSDSKKEFLADVVSFANTDGGHLLIGISEEKGIISEIKGIEMDNPDTYLQQIENTLRDQVKPRIIGLRMKTYLLENEKRVVHIYIPRSYNGPHMASERFFGRNSVGKYPLDYTEIRNKFLSQSGLGQKITEYHLGRVMKLKSNRGYLPLQEGATVLFNVIPFKSLTLDYDFVDLGTPETKKLWPLVGDGYTPYVDFNGIGGNSLMDEKGIYFSYHHLTHLGITELADKALLNSKRIFIQIIENQLINALGRIQSNYDRLNIEGPYSLSFSLLDVRDFTIIYSDTGFSLRKIQDHDLIFPNVIFHDFRNPRKIVQPIVKLLCHAAGLAEIPQRPF